MNKNGTLFIHLPNDKWVGIKSQYKSIGPIVKMFLDKLNATGWAFCETNDLKEMYSKADTFDIVLLN